MSNLDETFEVIQNNLRRSKKAYVTRHIKQRKDDETRNKVNKLSSMIDSMKFIEPWQKDVLIKVYIGLARNQNENNK